METRISPLSKIISLSCVLAAGFLLIVLSCALYSNWLPLVVVSFFVLAPMPNAVFGRMGQTSDFLSDGASGFVDFGRFVTGLLVTSGVALPVVLAHNHMIHKPAMVMSLLGGLLVYATIVTFGLFFHESEEF